MTSPLFGNPNNDLIPVPKCHSVCKRLAPAKRVRRPLAAMLVSCSNSQRKAKLLETPFPWTFLFSGRVANPSGKTSCPIGSENQAHIMNPEYIHFLFLLFVLELQICSLCFKSECKIITARIQTHSYRTVSVFETDICSNHSPPARLFFKKKNTMWIGHNICRIFFFLYIWVLGAQKWMFHNTIKANTAKMYWRKSSQFTQNTFRQITKNS